MECPEGYECPAGSDNPVICQAGTFSKAGATICTKCDPGQSTFNQLGQTECFNCPTGFSTDGNDGSPTCIECAENSYNDQIGNPICTLCAPGDLFLSLASL